MMNLKEKAQWIEQLPIKNTLKIQQLEDMILDCYNEMEAQDQNMHPEVQHDLAEGLRVTKDILRTLLAKETSH